MSSVSHQAQAKFSSVRQKLDQLGFRQTLSIDSLPLVERLLADLLWTTQQLRECKSELEKRRQIRAQAEQCVAPYKEDNAKLVKENSALHQRIIVMTQTHDEQMRDVRADLRKAHAEVDDLKFFNSQCLQKLRNCEGEMKTLMQTILQLQEKNFQAVVHTPSGTKKNIAFRRQRMDIDCSIPTPVSTDRSERDCCDVARHWNWLEAFGHHSNNNNNNTDPTCASFADVHDNTDTARLMIQQLATRCEQLQRDLATSEQEKQLCEHKIANFRRNVELRDAEIERLNQLLDGGRSLEALTAEREYRDNERLVAQLQLQMDILQQKNVDVEMNADKCQQQLNEQRQKLFELESRNKFLEEELKVASKKTQYSINNNNDDEKQLLEDSLKRVERERDQLKDTLRECQEFMKSNELDHKSIMNTIDQLTKDKTRLTKKLEQCSLREHDLALEVERSRRACVCNGNGGATKDPLQHYFREVEQDRDYWKQEAELLRETFADNAKAKTETVSKVDKRVKVLEEELLSLKVDNDRLRSRLAASPVPPPMSPQRRPDDKSEELDKLKQENDHLRSLLDKFERQLFDIQGNVHVLVQERDNLNRIYEQSRDELHKARQELIRSASAIHNKAASANRSPPSVSVQNMIKKLESEREDILTDLRRMTTERDSLRERLRAATERDLNERARLEQRVEDLLKECKNKEQENDDLTDRYRNHEADTIHIRQANQTLQQQLLESSQKFDSTVQQMKRLQEDLTQSQRHVSELENGLTQLETALNESGSCARILEDRVTSLEKEVKKLREENHHLKSTVKLLDEEKDSLMMELDERSEKLHSVQCQVTSNEALLGESKIALSAMEMHLSRAQESAALKDREVGTLRKQLEHVQSSWHQEQRRADNFKRDNARLQEDVTILTRENQSMQNELMDKCEERDSLTASTQQLLQQIHKLEDALGVKDQERCNLLEQYRLVSVESDRYHLEAEQKSSELSVARMEVIAREEEIRSLQQLQSQHAEQTHELKQRMAEQLNQIDDLKQALDECHNALTHSRSQQNQLLQDVTLLRDMCSRVESSKDAAVRDLANCERERDQIQHQVHQMNHEMTMLREQVTAEQANVASLETILCASREKEFQAQLDMQEREANYGTLRDRMELHETKIDQQQRELTRLRSRNAEMESEMDRLNRQITAERFEKERAIQDLRRQLHSQHVDLSTADSSRFRDVIPGLLPSEEENDDDDDDDDIDDADGNANEDVNSLSARRSSSDVDNSFEYRSQSHYAL